MYIAIIALITLQMFTIIIAIYLYGLTRKKRDDNVEPYSQFSIGACALGFALVILFLFYIFVGDEFKVSDNLGQVGDFVGGLTNPVLSFIALIVLLRTTLIQTVETRKTSSIMLEQQRLFEQERFESSFYKLLDRYEVSAEKYWRKTPEGEDYTRGINKVLELKKQRSEVDILPARKRIKEIGNAARRHLGNDRDKKAILRALQVFAFVNGSSLSLKRKKYYFSLLLDSMEPCEIVMFITMAFISPKTRKKLKAYSPAATLKSEFFVSQTVCSYYGGS
ncbi:MULTISPECIES: hypothetical protein [unclassified Pseudomonas]|uniref:hypothetical protein n=1 Tax=unclassified Pseudomonas TaxID=196821 RepID=UPI0006F7FE9C|nr:hypothetical protein [Pseudomonas sp. Leaf434]KQT67852.1 hypothetical protein ASG55_08225 [Pseudomonas sp. Leaf434]